MLINNFLYSEEASDVEAETSCVVVSNGLSHTFPVLYFTTGKGKLPFPFCVTVSHVLYTAYVLYECACVCCMGFVNVGVLNYT